MTVALGTHGVWRHAAGLTPGLAREIEGLGYGALWVGGSPPGDLALVESLLEATDRIAVATGIVNMWAVPADTVSAAYARIAKRYPGRFLLGVGIGHPEATSDYRRPYATIVDYLDGLDRGCVPRPAVVLAALGPKVLRLAGGRTAGAHPYLTTPEHTRTARDLLGDGALLAPEQTVVLDGDADRARATTRSMLRMYLGLRNYTSSFRTLGFTDDDLADGGSDRLVDALVAHGDPAAVAARVTAHLDAGADHVCVQALPAGDDPLPALRELAGALGLRAAD
jgi:probable F420-dependent oxidoreductase